MVYGKIGISNEVLHNEYLHKEYYINDADTIGSLFGKTYVTLSYAIYRGTWGVLRRRGGQFAYSRVSWLGELQGDAS